MKLHRVASAEPLLLFLIALIGGTLWLLKPVPDAAALVRPPAPQAAAVPPPVPAPRPQPAQPRSRPNVADVRAELEAARQAMREGAAALDAQIAEIEMLQRRVDALRTELAALEAQRAPMGPAAVTSAEESRTEDLVQERRAQMSHLESELANLKSALAAPLPDARKVPLAVHPSQKLPVLVDLSGNRIAPVTGEFFHLPMFTSSSVVVATRKSPGETIAEARAPNSQFARFLSKIHSETRYISCLLNSDSFEAFYAVRDMATRAGFDIAWEPADTRSGKIPIQKVKLVSKPRSPDDVVPLPDILREHAGKH
jgi:hypothetical protein